MKIYKIAFENNNIAYKLYESEKIARQQYACYALMGEPCNLIELALDDDNQIDYIDDEILVSGVVKYQSHGQLELSSISAGFINNRGVVCDEIAQYGETHISFYDPYELGNRVSFNGFIKLSEFENGSSYGTDRIKNYIRGEFVKWREKNVQNIG